MSDANTPASTGAPAAPATPPVAATPAAPAADNPTPAWLPDRLAQAAKVAQESLLKELGVTDPEKAKAAIAAAIKAEEDAKTAAQKLGETSKTLETEKQQRERYEAVIKDHATRQMTALTPERQAAVKAIAGDDAAAQLKAIDALLPTWSATTTQAAPAAPVAPQKPATPPSGTAPPPDAPAGVQTSPPDHAAIYAELEKTNPFKAARYALEHSRDLYK